MPKKKTQTSPYTIAIDIGYGYTQAMDSDGNEDIQPSGFCHLPHNLVGDELESAQRHYHALTLYRGDETLLLGSFADAHAGSPDKIIRLSGRENTATGNSFRAIMAQMAAARLRSGDDSGDVVHAELITGLPVDYLRDRAALKTALETQHRIVTDTTDFTLNVTKVRVMPQPLGTVYSYRLEPGGRLADFNYETVSVFDFGTLTAQVATHQNKGASGGFIAARSFSVDAGAHIIRNEILAWLEAEYGSRDMPLAKIDNAIKTGVLRVAGDDRDVSSVIDRGCKQILDIIERKANAQIGAALSADAIIVSGGIAPKMHPHIAAIYGASRTWLTDKPQWANVQGYLNFAQFAQFVK